MPVPAKQIFIYLYIYIFIYIFIYIYIHIYTYIYGQKYGEGYGEEREIIFPQFVVTIYFFFMKITNAAERGI